MSKEDDSNEGAEEMDSHNEDHEQYLHDRRGAAVDPSRVVSHSNHVLEGEASRQFAQHYPQSRYQQPHEDSGADLAAARRRATRTTRTTAHGR